MRTFYSGTRRCIPRKRHYDFGRVVANAQGDLFKAPTYHFIYTEDGVPHMHPTPFSSRAAANQGMRDYVEFLNK